MVMELLSVNVSLPRQRVRDGHVEVTGIDKQPVEGPVALGPLGLAGDGVGDTANHGGADQAVYVYTSADHDHWAAELGRPVRPGEFGENLTVRGPSSAELGVGDRLHIGDEVVIEVTAPRIPCQTFARQMDTPPQWVKRFLAAERPGAYCRVLVPGSVAAGDPVEHEPAPGPAFTVVDLQRLYGPSDAGAEERRAELDVALRTPLAERARGAIERRLAEL